LPLRDHSPYEMDLQVIMYRIPDEGKLVASFGPKVCDY
jgi:hypothetical protein